MDKDELGGLPQYSDVVRPWQNRRRRRRVARFVAASCLAYFGYSAYKIASNTEKASNLLSVTRLQEDYATCAALRRVPQDPSGAREVNDRWTETTKPLLVRNATVWTGEPGDSSDEYAWIKSDVFVDNGIIKEVSSEIDYDNLPHGVQIFDAAGRQLTSGIVDMHSHAGLGSLANLQGDENELSSDITPYVRSFDSIDPLHPEFQWIKSGGVTTSLLLPGSGNNIGGEAFVIKLAVGKESGRTEISATDMLADPDRNWRYIKMACGENPKRVYGKVGERGPFSRMGESWEFRHAFEQAQAVIKSQDDWCNAADVLGAENMGTYLPQDLQWETLGAVLRGQVRVNTHCYTIPDLEAFVDHTNEFKFRVRAFHHAHQTYLVPEILKRAWGGAPAAALFADNMYYKVESYTASEQAGKILHENGLTPVYVSDNPVLNSQHVKFEAAKAYMNGLPYHVALAGVTSAPADLLGLGERIGKIKPGFDADIVVWDSDPLSVGAAPVQVWIDGAPQFADPVLLKKPLCPPIEPDVTLGDIKDKKVAHKDVIFTGVSGVFVPGFDISEQANNTTVIISNGDITCVGTCEAEMKAANNVETIDLKNGYLTTPLTAFGSTLGLEEIAAQRETQDGRIPSTGWARAVDGLLFDNKQLAAAHSHGVVKAISPPQGARGVSVGFKTGAKHSLDHGAIFAPEVAIHYDLSLDAKDDKTPSISTAIGTLRRNLLEAITNNDTIKDAYSEKAYLRRVVSGALPLVLKAHSADTIATIITLKAEIEATSESALKVIVYGAAESYLVASELAEAKISVVVAPLLAYAQTWDQRRSLTGAPLTNGTAIDYLLDAGVLVAIGVEEVWETRDLRLAAAIAYRNGEGRVGEKEALGLVGGNVYKMLGLEEGNGKGKEFLVWEGSPLEIGARVRAVGAGEGLVDVFV